MKRGINDFLVSGEAIGFRVQNTIDYTAIQPEDDGLFLRVNGDGMTYGHRVPNQDLEWVESNTTDVTVGSSETELVRLTIDHDVTQENGSWAFTCKINNGASNQDDFVTLTLRDGGGTAIASKQFQIDKGDLGYPISMWGAFGQDWPSGSEFVLTAISGRNSSVMGTMTPTTLKVVEAQVAPVTMESLEAFDFSTLPHENPHIKGRLWVNRRGSLRVSLG